MEINLNELNECWNTMAISIKRMSSTLTWTSAHLENTLILEVNFVKGSKIGSMNIKGNKATLHIKGVLHLWALFLKTWCIFSKNKSTLDKASYGSGQKCSKELKNQFYFSTDHCCEVTVKNVPKSTFSIFEL